MHSENHPLTGARLRATPPLSLRKGVNNYAWY